MASHAFTNILEIIPARELRALGVLLADGAPTVGWGKTFGRIGRVFFTKTTVTRKRKVEKSIQREQKFGVL